jgi:hypothetical protein
MLNLKEIECEGVDWIHLAQDGIHFVGSYEHRNELLGPVKGIETTDFLRGLR